MLVGASGSHSVCVCNFHQNVALLAHSANEDYNNLLALMVCNSNSFDCMVHRCDNCPGIRKLNDYFHQKFTSEIENEAEITFKQWTKTHRSELVTKQETILDFINILIDSMNRLSSHSFIAKNQSKCLSELKCDITEKEAIISGGFAENYSFVVQDEIQLPLEYCIM